MKEKIERFSNGIFEYELPVICISENEIRITVQAGKVYEGSFTISNSAGRKMTGNVYSSNRCMQIQEASFNGVTNTIGYRFNAKNLKSREKIHGEFNIISDLGEISLLFTVEIEAPYGMSSMGKIKDLFQFTNLARMDWSDAKKMFRCEDFERIFLENEGRYKAIYRNLLGSISTSQALEEFLVTIHKKAAIRLDIDKTQVEYNVLDEKFVDKLTLNKNQWGYAEIRVSTDAPFIQLEQKFLWADRFIGNSYQVSYVIDPGLMRCGNNFGHIWIKTANQTLTLEVICKKKKAEHKVSFRRKQQRIESGLMDNYLGFCLNRIELSEYIEATEALIANLPGPEVNYVSELMKTHLAIISEKSHLAEELLSDFSKDEVILKKKSVLEYCAYLYLKALYYKDDIIIKNTAETIRQLYKNGNSDWRILWFLLYTDKHYEKNKNSKLADIKEQFDMGCRSPILYYEAVCIFNEEPYLLRELTDFEIQTLNFGIKNWILSKEAAKQYTYLTGKMKTFQPLVFNGLVKLYDEYDDKQILSAICCMLIKGMKKSEKYFEWYRLGVEAQLRITELYEYYMDTISDTMQDKITQSVLLYFIYNNSLSDRRKAFLYASIIKNKENNESMYHSYYKNIESFTLKMLENQCISRDLAVLYREYINRIELEDNLLDCLPNVLYRNELICNNPNMVSVIVAHRELQKEENVQLVNGKAQVDIFTNNAEIIFVDSFSNRFVQTVDYSVIPYMNAGEYETICVGHSNHPMLLLHLFDRYQSLRILNESSIEIRKKVLQIEGLSKKYATYCIQTLIDYYYENYNDQLLESYLNQIELEQLKPEDRTKYIEYLLMRTIYTKALEAMKIYGYEEIQINRLVSLCSAWIITSESETDRACIVNLCYYVFTHGKYDEAILGLLIKNYTGSTREMFLLWQVAQNFELDCHDLEERLLTQILYAQSYIEDSFLIFSSYYKNVTNHLLVRSFLTYYAYKYLVHEQVIDPGLFQIMKRELFYEENDVCLLAWLKFHTANEAFSENERIFAEYNMDRLVKKGIVLPFFLQYKNKINLPDNIVDKFIISYHTDPEKQVFLHYRLASNNDQDYIVERMENCFLGIHVKEFLLFYHEELQYYITEESGQDTNITESFNIKYDCGAYEEEDSKYSQINLMLMSKEMQDDNTLLDIMKNYAQKEYMISEFFKPLG